MTLESPQSTLPEIVLHGGIRLPAEIIQRTIEIHGERALPWLQALPDLVASLERRWLLTVTAPFPALSFNIVLDARMRDGQAAVLKIGLPDAEIPSEIAALQLVGGVGAVPVLHADPALGVMVLARLNPGTMLREVRDDVEATTIAAKAMRRYWRSVPSPSPFVTAADWARGFDRLRAAFDGRTGPLPSPLVERAEATYRDLLGDAPPDVTLHGDLHHDNILYSAEFGWTVIDPKGISGEAEYEVGAFMRNPGTFLHDAAIESKLTRRLAVFSECLGFDRQRLREWAVAQAVLSAWWTIEDGGQDWETGIAFAEHLARTGI